MSVGELRIGLKAEAAEEALGRRQVLDRDVDEDEAGLRGHGVSFAYLREKSRWKSRWPWLRPANWLDRSRFS